MRNISGSSPENRKPYRPEYPLVRKRLEDIEAYTPEKPEKRQNAGTKRQAAGEGEAGQRYAYQKAPEAPIEPVTRRKAHRIDPDSQVDMPAEVTRRNEMSVGDFVSSNAESRYERKSDPGTRVGRAALARRAMEENDDKDTPDEPSPRPRHEFDEDYVPRHTTQEDAGEHRTIRRGSSARHAIPEDLLVKPESKPQASGQSAMRRQAVPQDIYEEAEETPAPSGHSAMRRQAVPQDIYGEAEETPAPSRRSAMHRQQDAARQSSLARTVPTGAVVRAAERMPVPKAAPKPTLRVVDESLYGDERFGSEGTRRTSGIKTVPRDARRPAGKRRAPSTHPIQYAGSARQEKPGRRKGRIVLLVLGLLFTIGFMAALLMPGGWLIGGKTPLSTATALQPIVGADATPTPLPTVTATPESSATNTPSATPSATPTATASATATPKPSATPTAKPTATPTAKPTATPTTKPTATPTAKPTATPTAKPTATPTAAPTATPTMVPTEAPTDTGEVSP